MNTGKKRTIKRDKYWEKVFIANCNNIKITKVEGYPGIEQLRFQK